MLNKIEKVPPELARHHSNIEVVSYENHILHVKLPEKRSGGSRPC